MAHNKPQTVHNSRVPKEWYTPAYIIEPIRNALGGKIELDPASCGEANEVVKAERFYTAEEDGLIHSWESLTLFVNPPFTGIRHFADNLVSELSSIENAVWLSNNATETRWGQKILSHSKAVHFPLTRIRFSRPANIPTGPPQMAIQGQMIVYFGKMMIRFIECMQDLPGTIMCPVQKRGSWAAT